MCFICLIIKTPSSACNLELVSQKRFLRWYILFLFLEKLSTVVSLVFMVHKSFLQCFIFHTLSSKSKLRWVNFVIISYTIFHGSEFHFHLFCNFLQRWFSFLWHLTIPPFLSATKIDIIEKRIQN